MPYINIPRLDLLDFIGDDSEKQHVFSQELGKAFNETGFVMISNHGLKPYQIQELYDQIQIYFA
ncbi:MAG: 2-oxoglutarate and iron-dependent oxygenase domain-containing protein, partial [Bacteroidota bacterium]